MPYEREAHIIDTGREKHVSPGRRLWFICTLFPYPQSPQPKEAVNRMQKITIPNIHQKSSVI